ncbi:CHRD domain-containing protein [Streptomyces monticola]|uniref:CHRD domain-containing protein n=1 Tax=Streptomyces monticola TaxID=2666263 RepID=A0ABW2JZD8_9ACTN
MGAMTKRRRSVVAGSVAVAAAVGAAAAVIPAATDEGSDPGRGRGSGQVHGSVQVQGSGHESATILAAGLNGANEVPVAGGPAVGDKDGTALQFVKVSGDQVSFAVKWRGTARPTALHIHQGAKGANGGIKVDFTELLADARGGAKGHGAKVGGAKGGLKDHSATGTVTVTDQALLRQLSSAPNGFYVNLHTAEFPGGAVRGQLHKVTDPFNFRKALSGFQASVIKGRQIYECKKGDDGKLTFQQRDVRAVLGGNIVHSFVAPNSGTPQWIAPDGSAVTGEVISRTPNGAANIPELGLKATRSGKRHGLLARSAEILRLNTVGGVAPAGGCEAGAVVGVPYLADYVFVPR